MNTAPKFSKPLTSTLKVKLTKGSDGKIKDDSIVEYKSSTAIDEQNDKIIMIFDLGIGRKFLTTKQNFDNSFTLKADRATMAHVSVSVLVEITL
jgi:hypothetical protein